MNIILTIGENQVKKQATCVLSEAVSLNGEPIQGDFNCSLGFESSEQNISVENLTASTNNYEIGGCDELTIEESSPQETGTAISDSGNSSSILAVAYDYSIENNKNLKSSSLTITSFNLERCLSKAKIKVVGKFSENIIEEMIFELPFSYPASQVKCSIELSIKDTEVDLEKFKKLRNF